MPRKLNQHWPSLLLLLGSLWLCLGLGLGWPTAAMASSPPWVEARSVRSDHNLALGWSLQTKHALLWGNRCVVELQLGQYDQAIESCDRALALDAKNVTYQLNRGVAFYRQGNYQAALQDAEGALALNPRDYRGHYNRGLVHVALHDFTIAIQDFDQAVALGAESDFLADIYDDRGLAKLMAAQPAAAIRDFDLALALDHENIRALFNRGCACHQMGHLDDALASLNQVLVLAPNDARTYLKRGLLRQSAGDQAGGLADLHQAAHWAQSQGQSQLYHYILTVLNQGQRPLVRLG